MGEFHGSAQNSALWSLLIGRFCTAELDEQTLVSSAIMYESRDAMDAAGALSINLYYARRQHMQKHNKNQNTNYKLN